MNIRCRGCQRALWVETTHRCYSVVCRLCNTDHRFADGIDEKKASRIHVQASEFAKENEIDVPAAKSVLLGVMSLERVHEVATPPQPDATANASRSRYDVAFRDAVEKGQLTPLQAYQRGKREVYTERIATRHGLPRALAYKVADNEVYLVEALRHHRTGSPRVVDVEGRPRGTSVSASATAVAVVSGVFILVGLAGILQWGSPASRPLVSTTAEVPVSWNDRSATRQSEKKQVLRSASQVDRNEFGAVVRVVGSDPVSVLTAYCDALEGGDRFAPMRIVDAVPPSKLARLGLLQNRFDSGQDLAIPIRRDRDTPRWYAGDGVRPLRPDAAPETLFAAYPPSIVTPNPE